MASDHQTEHAVLIEHRIAELWRTINDAAAATTVLRQQIMDPTAHEQISRAFRKTLVYCFNTIEELQSEQESGRST